MNNTVGNLLNFIADAQKTLSEKASAFFVLFVLFLFIDGIGGYTYHYQLNNKINQLEKVHTLIGEYEQDSLVKTRLLILENQILERGHYLDFLNLLPSPNFFEWHNSVNSNLMNVIWMILSSSYIMILLFIFIPIAPFLQKTKPSLDNAYVASILIGWFFLFGAISLFTFLAYQIPIVSKEYLFINYIINFLLHTLVVYFISRWLGTLNRSFQKGKSLSKQSS